MPLEIDLNADVGEGCLHDAALFARISSANICCGAHAGGDSEMRSALKRARQHGVCVGAHPGFADRENFGRVPHRLDTDALCSLLLKQVDALSGFAEELGVPVRYLKPHGALYNMAFHDAESANAVARVALERRLDVMGMPGGAIEDAAARRGVRFIAEGFVDRGYDSSGGLLPRSAKGAVLSDPHEIAAQVRRLVEWPTRRTQIRSLCLHGDRTDAIAVADIALSALREAGVRIRGLYQSLP